METACKTTSVLRPASRKVAVEKS